MKVSKPIKAIIICGVLISANVNATVSGKQPERNTESSVTWFDSVMNYFGF